MNHCGTYIMRDQMRNVVPSLMARKRAPVLRKLLRPLRMPLIGFGGMLLLIL